jgi:hypothetical protein
MSFYGGVRVVLLGWKKSAAEPFGAPLDPIRPGAWAEWARASTFQNVVDAELGESCLTADGRTGRVVAVFDGTSWVAVCDAA